MPKTKKKHSMQSGVALYLAVLIGTTLMATGLGISTIFYRELRISGVQFPSRVAYYAADTGSECTKYWDFVGNVFDDPTANATVTCNGVTQTIPPVLGSDGNGPYHSYSFQFQLSSAVQNACVRVTVKKQVVGTDSCTLISSDGENTACGSPTTAVQRGINDVDPETCAITGN